MMRFVGCVCNSVVAVIQEKADGAGAGAAPKEPKPKKEKPKREPKPAADGEAAEGSEKPKRERVKREGKPKREGKRPKAEEGSAEAGAEVADGEGDQESSEPPAKVDKPNKEKYQANKARLEAGIAEAEKKADALTREIEAKQAIRQALRDERKGYDQAHQREREKLKPLQAEAEEILKQIQAVEVCLVWCVGAHLLCRSKTRRSVSDWLRRRKSSSTGLM